MMDLCIIKRICVLNSVSPLLSAYLLAHERVHLGLAHKYKCQTCGATMKTSSSLKKHQYTHLPKSDRPKPFPCLLCPLKFATERVLKRHQLVHTKVRDAKCEFCDKAYLQKSVLKLHLMSVHKLSEREAITSAKMKGRVPIEIINGDPKILKRKPGTTCALCSRKYSRREFLTTHLIAIHGKSDEEAKSMTGLETTRNLTVPKNPKRTGRKRKKSEDSDDDSTEDPAPVPSVPDPDAQSHSSSVLGPLVQEVIQESTKTTNSTEMWDTSIRLQLNSST